MSDDKEDSHTLLKQLEAMLEIANNRKMLTDSRIRRLVAKLSVLSSDIDHYASGSSEIGDVEEHLTSLRNQFYNAEDELEKSRRSLEEKSIVIDMLKEAVSVRKEELESEKAKLQGEIEDARGGAPNPAPHNPTSASLDSSRADSQQDRNSV